MYYHYADGGDVNTEAQHFVDVTAGSLVQGEGLVLDWEIENTDPVGCVNAFVMYVHNSTGIWPLVYMDLDRLGRYDWSPVLANCGLWIAAPSFGSDATVPTSTTYVMHQYGTGNVDGIVGAVDLDHWVGTAAQLMEYGKQIPPTPPVDVDVQPPTPPVTVTVNTTAPLIHDVTPVTVNKETPTVNVRTTTTTVPAINSNKIKPGYKTSEFWLTLVYNVLMYITTIPGSNPFALKVITYASMALTIVSYVLGRSTVKQNT
jgi:hypothetical protein